jgi:plastocyanin
MNKMFLMAFLVLAVLAAGCTQPTPVVPPKNTTVGSAASVMITSFSFEPSTVTVPKGAAVTWTNQDPVAHTITGTDFDSGAVGPGQNYSHVFDKVGTYYYHCAIHPSMKGTITVQ